MTHKCVSKLTIIGSDNGLSPGRHQAIIWTNAGLLLIWPLGTNFSEISIEIHAFSFKKMHLKMSSGKWRPFVSASICWYSGITFLWPGGRFKNAYELLNLRALKILMLFISHIFQCMGKIFCVEFQRVPLKFHTKYHTHTLKDADFINGWKFKSS